MSTINKSKLKDKICFIGIGQCGGNIAVQAKREGFSSGIINTSYEDTESESMRIITDKLIVGNTGGCGKDRTIGQDIVKKEYKTIVNWIKEKFIDIIDDIKIIYLCFSTSGGTGSGIGPILINVLQKMFEYSDITFSAIAVVPEIEESTVSLYNSRKCLEELYKLNIPLLIPDNSKATNKSSRKALYDNINKNIIKGISNFLEDRESSTISNMDQKDKLKLLSTNGIMTIAVTPVVENELSDPNSLSNVIQVAINHSVYTNNKLTRLIRRIGFIFEIPEKYSKNIDYKIISKDIGSSTEVFEGIYDKGKNDIYSITIILTGLPFPESKIKEISDILKNDTEITKKMIEEQKSNPFDDIFDEEDIFDGFFNEDTKKNKNNKSNGLSEKNISSSLDLESLFNQY